MMTAISMLSKRPVLRFTVGGFQNWTFRQHKFSRQSASLFRCKHNKQSNYTTVRLITIHWKCVKLQQVAAKGPSGLRVEQQPFVTNYT